MTIYRTCRGCVYDNMECEARSELRRRLKGLCITSVKWQCKQRVPAFKVGDAVWCQTVGDYSTGDGGPYGEAPEVDDFPGHVTRVSDTHVYVYIPAGAHGRDCGEDYKFSPVKGGNGFCKFPFSRVMHRDAEAVEICPECSLPAPHGHLEGYSCDYRLKHEDAA